MTNQVISSNIHLISVLQKLKYWPDYSASWLRNFSFLHYYFQQHNSSMNVVMLYLLNKSTVNEFGYITNFIELMTVMPIVTFIICCTGHIIYLHWREHSALARYIHGSLSVSLRYLRRHQRVIRSHLLLFPLSLKPCCIAPTGKYCILQHLVLYKCSLKFHWIKFLFGKRCTVFLSTASFSAINLNPWWWRDYIPSESLERLT